MISDKIHNEVTSFRAAGCFCMLDNDVLVIQRQKAKSFGLHWAIPTGKIEPGESPAECMARELGEELGLSTDVSSLIHLNDFIVTTDSTKFEYIAFILQLDDEPSFTLKPDEVRITQWVPKTKILKRRVVPYFYNTVRDLLEWDLHCDLQRRLFPEKEKSSARDKRPGNRSEVRIQRSSDREGDKRQIWPGARRDLFG